MDFNQNLGSALPWRPTSSLGLPLLVMMMMILFYLSNGLLAQPDLPCSLSTGMSRESFTANELLPIGSIVGVLNIVGDPSENGTIELRLSQDDAVIEIPEGTKNITLRKRLDREGKDGPSEVTLQVYCRKKDSSQLVFPIPLRIFVNDANDNIPEFVDTPEMLKISEITQPGTVVTHRPIRAVDGDQTGPFSTVQYSVENGPYSDHFEFPNPLKGILMLTHSLDYEEVHHFNITIRAQDLGNPPAVSKISIPVHVMDADDLNPSFDDERYASVIPDQAQVATILEVKPRAINARDMDRGINASIEYSFKSDQVDGKYFAINNTTGEVTLVRPFADDVVFPLTLVIKASQEDNAERSALTTLSVSPYSSVNGDLHFLLPRYTRNIPETFPVNQTLVLLQTNKPHVQRLYFSLVNGSVDYFNVNKRGEVLLRSPLNYDQVQLISVVVKVADGKFSDYTEVDVTIDDVNRHNPKFASQLYNFVVTDSNLQAGLTLGQIQVGDEDQSEQVNLTLVGEDANRFAISEEGVIQVLNSTVLNSSLTHLVVVATDTGHPPRTSSVPIIITVPDELRLGSMSLFAADSSYLLMIIFGATLGVLVLVVLVLALYIAKHKNTSSDSNSRQSSQPLNKLNSYMNGSVHEKLLHGTRANGRENPTFRSDSQDEASPSVSPSNRSLASASTALAKNESRESKLMTTLCAKSEANRSISSITSENDAENGRKTAPRRVKKLSWQDEKVSNKTELDVAVSVTPLGMNSQDPENSCYF